MLIMMMCGTSMFPKSRVSWYNFGANCCMRFPKQLIYTDTPYTPMKDGALLLATGAFDKDGLSSKVSSFLEKALCFAKKRDLRVVSIILFGSSLRRDYEEATSDIDAIFVVDDSSTESAINDFRLYLASMKRSVLGQGPISLILNLVSRQTGMFISGFVCRQCSLLNLDFPQIFGISSKFSQLLAPSKLVLCSVLSNAKTVMGEDLLATISPPTIDFSQLARSLLMNLLLALSSLLIVLFSHHAVRFSLESLKWAIHSSHFFVFNKINALNEEVRNLGFAEKYPRIIERLLRLRRHPTPDPYFSLIVIWYVLRFHVDAYRMAPTARSLKS